MRQRLSPGGLYARLQSEFKRRKAVACDLCRVPLPYLIERPDEASANWRLGTTQPCVHKCDLVLNEIAAELWPQFDLNDPIAVPVREAASPHDDGAVEPG